MNFIHDYKRSRTFTFFDFFDSMSFTSIERILMSQPFTPTPQPLDRKFGSAIFFRSLVILIQRERCKSSPLRSLFVYLVTSIVSIPDRLVFFLLLRSFSVPLPPTYTQTLILLTGTLNITYSSFYSL